MKKNLLLILFTLLFSQYGYSVERITNDDEKIDIVEEPKINPKEDRSIKNVECYLSRSENTISVEYSGKTFGISGVSNDNRDVVAAAKEGNERAQLALDMQRYQIIKFIGSYAAAMNGVDAIVFTGGIGENDKGLRKEILDSFTYMGVEISDEKNAIHGEEVKISTENSKVNVYVIPTNEELAIARDTLAIISK